MAIFRQRHSKEARTKNYKRVLYHLQLYKNIVKSKKYSQRIALNQLVFLLNMICISSQTSETQRQISNRKNRDKNFSKRIYPLKSYISFESFHFNLAVVHGDNCAFVGSSSNSHQKEISLFKTANC